MYRQLVILYDTHRQRERQLLEQRDEKTDLVNTSQKNKALFDAVEKLMNDEHLYRSNSISIDMLVERLHSNRTYLSRMFTEQNTSFSEYINSYRIREALALLSEPENDIPLKVLSDSLGYNSLSSFYRAFQKEMGVPPSRFRQEIKKTTFGLVIPLNPLLNTANPLYPTRVVCLSRYFPAYPQSFRKLSKLTN